MPNALHVGPLIINSQSYNISIINSLLNDSVTNAKKERKINAFTTKQQ